MPSETISVVIPAFNAERFLAEALSSVFAQTRPATEIIVVDDGSTDGTSLIVGNYPTATLISLPHSGVSVARNAGVAATTGDFIAFLDADDIWEPRKLELQMDLLKKEPSVGVVMCRHTYAFEGPIPAWFRGPRDGSVGPGHLLTTALIRRRVWDEVGVFEPMMSHGEDGDWLARAVDLNATLAVVDEPLMTYRIHQSNASGMGQAVREGIFRTLRGSLRRKEQLSQ